MGFIFFAFARKSSDNITEKKLKTKGEKFIMTFGRKRNMKKTENLFYTTNARLVNRVDCPASRNRQGEPLTPLYVRVTYTAVR